MTPLIAPAPVSVPTPEAPDSAATIHLVGAGPVGRALLDLLAARPDDRPPVRLVALSDTSGTTYARRGLDVREIRRFKADGGRACDHPQGRAVATEVAVDLVAADVVVDATSTNPAHAQAALVRAQAALRTGARLVLAGKDALAHGATRLPRERIGCNAVLGGTGARLLSERHDLADCDAVALVPNASTTAILTSVESGASVAEGIEEARRRGILEADATLDLDGSDAAVKLAAVVALLWGRRVAFEEIERESLVSVDAVQVRAARAAGQCVRLVARATRTGPLRVCHEVLSREAALAVPSDRVAYQYSWRDGRRRIHIGKGLGPERTARALLVDVEDCLAKRAATERNAR